MFSLRFLGHLVLRPAFLCPISLRLVALRLVSVQLLALGGTVGCAGGVQHPDAGEENEEGYCANRPDYENNCMACSALPGCGWCDSPKGDQAHCQPGIAQDAPTSCAGGWALSSEDCAVPPPPPPPPPSEDPPASEENDPDRSQGSLTD